MISEVVLSLAYKKIMISAGEASGDLYGARLVAEARAIDPTLAFFGMGGAEMRAAGVETVVDANEMAVMGLVEVVRHLPVIMRGFRTMKELFQSRCPDLLILIDYQDFNQRLAAAAKAAGIPVLFYISPQVWAWRAGRVKKMAKIVDHMAVLFDFEVPYYEREGVPVTFTGHPLLDLAVPTVTRDDAFASFGLDPARRVVGIFPGSRKSEIAHIFPSLLAAAKILQRRFPDLQFVLPLAKTLTREDVEPGIEAAGLNVAVVSAASSTDVIQCCSAIMSVSGTVTMEIALQGVPMVIVYRMSPLTYFIGKKVIRVDHIGISNIVAGERVVPELIQQDATPENIAAETARYLDDAAYAEEVRGKLLDTRRRLGSGGCSRKVAELAVRLAGRAA